MDVTYGVYMDVVGLGKWERVVCSAVSEEAKINNQNENEAQA